jgi:hypothetical protein
MEHPLVEAYIAALPFTAVAIVTNAAGRCRIVAGAEPEEGETIFLRLYFKQAHVELVLYAVGLEGWTDETPTAVVARIARAGVALGAPAYALEALRRAAEDAIARVNAQIFDAQHNGDLKQLNKQYKSYRLGQKAKGERAMSYSSFLAQFSATLVRGVAARGI